MATSVITRSSFCSMCLFKRAWQPLKELPHLAQNSQWTELSNEVLHNPLPLGHVATSWKAMIWLWSRAFKGVAALLGSATTILLHKEGLVKTEVQPLQLKLHWNSQNIYANTMSVLLLWSNAFWKTKLMNPLPPGGVPCSKFVLFTIIIQPMHNKEGTTFC